MSLSLARCTRSSGSHYLPVLSVYKRAASTKTKPAPSKWEEAKEHAKTELAKLPRKPTGKPVKKVAAGTYVPPAKANEMEQMHFAQRMNPKMDLNSMTFQLLDVSVPHDLFAKTRGRDPIAAFASKTVSFVRQHILRRPPSRTADISDSYLKSTWTSYLSPLWLWNWIRDPALRRQAAENRGNRYKNMFCMYQCAVVQTFSSVDTSKQNIWHIMTRWAKPVIFGTQHNTSAKWLDAWRAEAIDSYFGMMSALSRRDERTLKAFTASVQQTSALRQLRALNPTHKYTWSGNEDTHPPFADIVSIRAASAYTSAAEPRQGNRLLVQLAVRFETWQTLNVRDARGAVVGPKNPEPRRVVNYFVLERRMWHDSPWVVREELFPSVPAGATIPLL